jgi:hypothetical protein
MKKSKTSKTNKTSKINKTSHAITTNPNSADLFSKLPPDMIKQISRHLESNQRIKPTKGKISVTVTEGEKPRLLYELDNKTDNRTRILFRDFVLSNRGKKLAKEMKNHILFSELGTYNLGIFYSIFKFLEELYIPQQYNTPLIANTKPLTKPHITVKEISNIKTTNERGKRVKYKSYKFNVQNYRHGRSTRSHTTNRGTVKNLLQTSKSVRSALQPMSLNNTRIFWLRTKEDPQGYRMVPNPRKGTYTPNLTTNKQGSWGVWNPGLTRHIQDVKEFNKHYEKQIEHIQNLVRNNTNPDPSRSRSKKPVTRSYQ